MNRLTEQYTIPCYDTDASWRLKPVSFMNYAQEMANRHASILGFGYDDLIESKTAWVLARMNIRFVNLPVWRDNVSLTTWHKGLNRLFFVRDFQMKDAQGNFIYDVFKNPSIGIYWKEPCEVLHLAIKCLKHFIDLDDLPQA